MTRLFNIVQPDTAVFGQKDYQQVAIIRRLQADLCLPIRIVVAPTARDPDGLALSSRNQYLDADGRVRAPGMYRALVACTTRLRDGEKEFSALEKSGVGDLAAAGFRPDYFAIRNAADLSSPTATSRQLVVLAAGHLGRARLIDNVLVDL